MAECGKMVGSGRVAYSCRVQVPRPGDDHPGPCAAREDARSERRRRDWEETQARVAASPVPSLSALGQGPARTAVDGLFEHEQDKAERRIHPDERIQIAKGNSFAGRPRALEDELVRTAGGVDISGVTSRPDSRYLMYERNQGVEHDQYEEDDLDVAKPEPQPYATVEIPLKNLSDEEWAALHAERGAPTMRVVVYAAQESLGMIEGIVNTIADASMAVVDALDAAFPMGLPTNVVEALQNLAIAIGE
jgi:hypothetical protein